MKETNIRAKLLCLKENCTEVTICFFVLFLAPLLKSKYTWVCIHINALTKYARVVMEGTSVVGLLLRAQIVVMYF